MYEELIALASVGAAEQAKDSIEDSMKEAMTTTFPTAPVAVNRR